MPRPAAEPSGDTELPCSAQSEANSAAQSASPPSKPTRTAKTFISDMFRCPSPSASSARNTPDTIVEREAGATVPEGRGALELEGADPPASSKGTACSWRADITDPSSSSVQKSASSLAMREKASRLMPCCGSTPFSVQSKTNSSSHSLEKEPWKPVSAAKRYISLALSRPSRSRSQSSNTERSSSLLPPSSLPEGDGTSWKLLKPPWSWKNWPPPPPSPIPGGGLCGGSKPGGGGGRPGGGLERATAGGKGRSPWKAKGWTPEPRASARGWATSRNSCSGNFARRSRSSSSVQ
mmetsp:Transcript_13371/g.23955  ORF Transcript_13371/g.23955 Transcript_13371/m.23955 type:complete len:294 (-) Transcript_13371:564-1445(-)